MTIPSLTARAGRARLALAALLVAATCMLVPGQAMAQETCE